MVCNTLDLKFFGVQAANLVENIPLLKCVYTPLLYARQAKTFRSGAGEVKGQALQYPHRTGLSRLDQALYPVSR